MAQKKIKKSNNRAMKVGLGVAAVSAAAIGAYLLSGKKGAKNRKVVKGWMKKAKHELAAELKKDKHISLKAYDALVKSLAQKYKEMKDVDKAELASFVEELKDTGKYALLAAVSKGGAKKKGKTAQKSAGKAKKAAKKGGKKRK